MYNTTIRNNSFSEQEIQAVWEKGAIVPGYNSKWVRRDKCGALMEREVYGDVKSKFGWEIDHVLPKSKGGSDSLSNLQPLQWENNRHKSDNYPTWYCKVRA